MITTSNLKEVLPLIGYKGHGNYFTKQYPEFDCHISVDFANEKINYPEDKGLLVHQGSTCNFAHPENFVVLECVTRLMDKGYRPEHIEIEKQWPLGHDPKSGRADILVKESTGKTLSIIECKTYGREYDKALKNTINDGAQLFSYWQQERYCKWLVLYASTLDGNSIDYTTCAINCSDDKNLIELAKKDASILLYKNAYTVPELYNVWKETYERRLLGDILFRDDSIAYQVGVKPLRKKDLIDFTGKDRVVNKFEEILRHNNVSDKENAFNRLIALFICKLVDEIQKTDTDVVDFQYKIGTDTYESLQDRLQRLHKEGMEKFMKEDIFYIPEDYAKKTILQYTGDNRKELIKELDKTLKILKFYTNNDFAFKDVHNEELFLQNGKILVEVVKLFENYRIIGSNNLQMLGDLFEQLLNKGFKQNEGQFFTPVPITRFIWDSLPLEKMVRQDEKTNTPKIIDYACGAGHFLTEGFEAINDVFTWIDPEAAVDFSWARDNIYGVEKDYRLARVSKISLFMHGAGDGNIIFGDGLENYKEKGIVPETFDVLVANPPYSVSAFKPHLNLKNNDFNVLDKISNNGSEIETLFVERISQLLKPKAVAAVILPSSILNKENESFIAARESVLENFAIKAIVSLSDKTFGATGTNTVILFLEKYDEPPKRIDLIKDTVDTILSGQSLEHWEDEIVFAEYLKTIGLTKEDYYDFILKKINYADYTSKYFKNYVAEFLNLSATKVKKKQKTFSKLPKDEQNATLNKMFYDYALEVEREKIKYFALIYKNRTLIVNAPADNKAQEAFLGYKWSNRKGQEGIQITSPGGQLYDETNRQSGNTLASLIRRMFDNEEYSIEGLEEYYYYLNTKDMLDFGSVNFNKGIVTSKQNTELNKERNFRTDKISSLFLINQLTFNPQKTPEDIYHYVDISSINSTENTIDFSNEIKGSNAPSRARRIAKKGDVLISTVRPYLKSFALVDDMPQNSIFSTGFAILESKNKEKMLNEFLYTLFLYDPILMEQIKSKMTKGSYPSINANDIKNFTVIVPSKREQIKIVEDFAFFENKIKEEKNLLKKYDEDIKSKFAEMFGVLNMDSNKWGYKKLHEICDVRDGTHESPKYVKAGFPLLTSQNFTNGFVDLSNVNYISKEDFDSINLRSKVDVGDIIMPMIGTIGSPVIVDTSEEFAIKNVALIKFKNSKFKAEYIKQILDSDYFDDIIQKSNRGSNRKFISLGDIRNINILNAPTHLQDEFASYVEEIDKLKFEANQRKEKAETEKENLIDKYFR